MSDLRITKGNTFRTILEVKAYRYDNTEIKDFDLTNCIDMRIKCRIDGVIRDITQFRVIGPNQIEILWEKGKPGAYTIEMTGKYKQLNWRYYSKNPIFKIVDTTEDQNIPEDAVLKNGTYYIQGSRIYLLASNPSEIKIDKTTGHWMVGGEDTGFTARGEKGEKGDKGDPGEGVGDYTQLKNLPNLARVALTGDYSDLDNKPTIPTVPTRISQLINDAGFVTNSNIVKNYYNKTEVDEISNDILQNLAVVQVDDLDELIECGLYRIDETTELQTELGPRFSSITTMTPRLIAVVSKVTVRPPQPFRHEVIFQYDLQNRTVREAMLSADFGDNTVGEWSDWMSMDNFAVKALSENNGDVIDDIVEPGVYRMDYTERAGLFDNSTTDLVIVNNLFDQDTRTTYQLRINSDGIRLYERTDEVELSEDGEINVLDEGEWNQGTDLYLEPLVSGQNIATINGVSLLDGGNITVTAEAAYVQEQADWNQTDSTAVDYIKNKPDLSGYIEDWLLNSLSDTVNQLNTELEYLKNSYKYTTSPLIEQGTDVYLDENTYTDLKNINDSLTFHFPIPYDDLGDYLENDTVDLYLQLTFGTFPQNGTISFISSIVGGGVRYDENSKQIKFDSSSTNVLHCYFIHGVWHISNVTPSYIYNQIVNNKQTVEISQEHNIGLSDFATVAFTGAYNDLQGKPNIPSQVQLIINNSNFVTQSDLSGKVNASDLADVAFSGSYNDLINIPQLVTVPTNVSAFTNDAGYITNAALNNYYTKAQIDAALAESGNFNPELYYTKTYIDNLLSSYSTITSTNSKLSGKVDVSTFNTFKATLKNVATSGSYSDLTGTPTKLSDFYNDKGFLTEQKNSDWNAVSGVEEIKNKPDLSIYAEKTQLYGLSENSFEVHNAPSGYRTGGLTPGYSVLHNTNLGASEQIEIVEDFYNNYSKNLQDEFSSHAYEIISEYLQVDIMVVVYWENTGIPYYKIYRVTWSNQVDSANPGVFRIVTFPVSNGGDWDLNVYIILLGNRSDFTVLTIQGTWTISD